MARPKYDCMKCPGYCCSYPVIEVKDRDAERIAKHFGIPLKEAEKRFFKSAHGYKRVFRRKKDEHFGKICTFFDTKERRCGIYPARPSTCRVFPGEGVHSEALAALVTRLHSLGYRGDYSFEVFNDDYQQLPLPVVAQRAWRSALWLGEDVLRRSVPLPNQIRLKRRMGR